MSICVFFPWIALHFYFAYVWIPHLGRCSKVIQLDERNFSFPEGADLRILWVPRRLWCPNQTYNSGRHFAEGGRFIFPASVTQILILGESIISLLALAVERLFLESYYGICWNRLQPGLPWFSRFTNELKYYLLFRIPNLESSFAAILQ